MAGRKLLLADDSITIQKVVNLTFADEGIEVLTVGDGDSAVTKIADEMPNLVMADVNMPGLNGYQVCERLRSDERTRHIPVILLVGAFEQFDEAEAGRVGATAHLTKPFQSIRQLVNQVTDLIEVSHQSAPVDQVIEPQPEAPPVESQAPQVATNPFDEPVRSQFETFREDRIASLDHERGSVAAPSPDPFELEQPGEPARPEAEDIDRLYRQSIGEEPPLAEGEFPDLGVDDEMIETSYSAPQPDDVDLEVPAVEQDRPAEYSEEAPISINDEAPESRPISPYETTNLSAADIPAVEHAPEPVGTNETVRLDPEMVEARMAEVNRQFESADQTSEADPSASAIGEETIRMGSRFDTPGSATYEFNDVDLLDIPTEDEVEITTPAEAAAKGGKQLVTLSPELIEMIAQRVVEKLSEKY